jgi:hypothetical protein
MPATDSPATVTPVTLPVSRARRGTVWAVTIAVTAGAAWLTAHGLHEVAVASRVPSGRAWVYPLVTDGMALVAYAATRCLTAGQRRYAWLVVGLAAVLSGVAQASYLAGTVTVAPAWLRAGIGFWPAAAAVIAAHLVYLLAPRGTAAVTAATVPVTPPTAVGTDSATYNVPAVSLQVPVSPRPRPVSPRPVTPASDSARDAKAARLRDTPARDRGMAYPAIARELRCSVRTARRAVERGRAFRASAGPAVPRDPDGPAGSTDPDPAPSLHAV